MLIRVWLAAVVLISANSTAWARCTVDANRTANGVVEFVFEDDGDGREYATWTAAMRAAEFRSAFNVSGHVRYPGNVIKATLVTFSTESMLEFTDVDAPFWAIVAEKLVFEGEATVSRNRDYALPTPDPAFDGSLGQGYGGRSGCCHGRAGHPGANGGDGRVGFSKHLPCFLVIAESVEVRGDTRPEDIRVNLRGIDGGKGGKGGKGGDGGQGEAGADASWGGFRCRRTQRDGGNGGAAGSGGRGGNGGHGGRGSDVLFIGPRSAGETFMSFQIRNKGGKPGSEGEPGGSGSPGAGGDRGHARGRLCFRSAQPGARGAYGSRGAPGSSGDWGAAGAKGIVAVTDEDGMADFFGLMEMTGRR